MSYERDARVRAGSRRSRELQDHRTLELEFVLVDAETDEELTVRVPAKYELCRTCQGRGQHVNPSIDSHGISPDEFEEDPDFRDDYLSGVYDVDCYDCDGRTTLLIPDEDRMTDEQKALVERRDEEEAEAARDAAEYAYEQRMGY